MDHVIQSKPGLLTIMKGWYSSTKEDHNMRWTHGLPNVMTNYCCYKGRMVQKHMNITVIFEESRRTIIWGGLKTYVYLMLRRKGHRTDYDTKWITGLMTLMKRIWYRKCIFLNLVRSIKEDHILRCYGIVMKKGQHTIYKTIPRMYRLRWWLRWRNGSDGFGV